MRLNWLVTAEAFKIGDAAQHPLSTALQKTQALGVEQLLQARGVLGALRQRDEPELEGSYVRLTRLFIRTAATEQL